MESFLRVVIVEDSAVEAQLAERELQNGGLSCHTFRVETREEFCEALAGLAPDVIIADAVLTTFSGMEALEVAKQTAPWTPFVVVTDRLDDAQAASFLNAGADECITRDHLARLGPAVRSALESRRIRRENDATVAALSESEERYRRLFELESDGILFVDNATGQILEANAAATRLYGYTREEWLRMNHSQVSTEPEKTRQVALQKITRIPLRWHVRKDGSLFPAEVTCSHFDWRGRSVHVAAVRDVSERVRADEELNRSRAELLEAQRIAQVGNWRVTVATGETEWSAEMGRIFGVDASVRAPSVEEARRLIHPEDRERFDGFVAEGACGSEPREIEVRVVRPDGTLRYVVVRGEVEAVEGRRVALHGTAQDITERRKGQRLQTALLEISEAAQATHDATQLFGALHAIVSRLLPAPNFLFALYNPASGLLEFPYFVDETGVSPEPVKPGSGLTGSLLRTGQAVLRSGEALLELERRGEALRIGLEPVSWLGVPLKVGGNVIGAMVLQTYTRSVVYTEEDKELLSLVASAAAQAIERKRAEERLSQMHERLELAARAAHLGVWDWDIRKNRMVWDDRMCELYGLEGEEFAGTYATWLEGIHPDDRAGVSRRVGEALRGTSGFDAEFRVVRGDGAVRHVRAYAQVVRDPNGAAVRMAGVDYDLTERRMLEEQLQQSQKMEAIGILAGGVAHDFNNLLQAMLSVVQSLREGGADLAAVDAQLGVLEDHVRRGAQLTRQLLLFSRREITAPETLDLSETVSAAGQMLRRLLRENISLEFDLAPARVRIQADRGQVEQVLINLALNAADAMPLGGRLVVRTGRQGGDVWLEVRDTGTGIPEEIRDRIFEPFFTTKPAGKGTGLGLSVVHGIVTSHGGTIRVDSEVGKGTNVRITLCAAPDVVARPESGDDPGRQYAGGSGEKVLVVEDEKGAREGLCELLTVLGYAVAVAASAEEAAGLDAGREFDVLLTDMMLPGLSGIELAARLRQHRPDLKVILMSGYTDEDLVRQGVQVGDLRFLQKPFDMATLARVVRETLNDTPPRAAEEATLP